MKSDNLARHLEEDRNQPFSLNYSEAPKTAAEVKQKKSDLVPSPIGSGWKPIAGLFIIVNIGLLYLGGSAGFVNTERLPLAAITHVLSLLLGFGALLAFEQDSLKRAVSDLLGGTVQASGLMLIGVSILAISGIYEWSQSSLLWSSLESMAIVIGLYLVSSWAVRAFVGRTFFGCTFIPDDVPSFVCRVTESGEEAVALSEVSVGDHLLLSPGDKLVFDGVVLDGHAEVLERRLTGLSTIKIKEEGATVFAGSEVRQGKVLMRVDAKMDEGFIHSFAAPVRDGLTQVIERVNASTRDLQRAGWAAIFVAGLVIALGVSNGVSLSETLPRAASVVLVGMLMEGLLLPIYLRRRILLAGYGRGIIFKDFDRAVEQSGAAATCVVDINADFKTDRWSVGELELLDDRIDVGSLASVLVSLCGRSALPLHEAFAGALRKRFPQVSLYRPADLKIYDSTDGLPGLLGVIEGIEFCIGPEHFLVTRGVQVLTSDVSDSDPKLGLSYYISVSDEIVARCRVTPRGWREDAEALKRLRATRVRTIACTSLPLEESQQIANAIGLDYTDTFTGLTPAQKEETVRRLGPSIVVTDGESDKGVLSAAGLVSGPFSEYQWGTDRYDVTVFGRLISSTSWFMRQARALIGLDGALRRFVYGVAAATTFGAAVSFIDPVSAMAIVTIGLLYCRTISVPLLKSLEEA